MPKVREAYIHRDYPLANSGTLAERIRIVDPITELYFAFEATAEDRVIDYPLMPLISKVELVDGSDVLESLSFIQWQAVEWADRGHVPHMVIDERLKVHNYCSCKIPFGRRLDDPVWIFDPKKFKNPEWRITWNMGTGAGKYVDGSLKLTCKAYIIEEGATPKGFFMHKQHFSRTTAAAGDDYVDLPTDHPYRKFYSRFYKSDAAMDDILTKHKLSVDHDKYIPFELYSDDWLRNMYSWFPEAEIHLFSEVNNNSVKQNYMGYEPQCVGAKSSNIGVASIEDKWSNRTWFDLFDWAGAAVTDHNVPCEWSSRGQAFHNVAVFPFGDQNVEEEWLQAPRYGHIRYIFTMGTADAEMQVLLQQARKY